MSTLISLLSSEYGRPPFEQRASMPAYFIPSYFAVLISSILIPTQPLRKIVVTAIVACYLWIAFFHMTGGLSADYQNMTMMLSSALMWLDFGVLQNVEKHGFRTWEQQDLSISDRPLWEKLAWSYDLWTTWRGPGWSWYSKRSPRLPVHVSDKRSFLIYNIKRGFYCWVMTQVLLCFLESTPYARLEGRQHIHSAPLHMQLAVVWVAAIYTQYNMSLVYRLITSVLVLAGICSPAQCPPLFGSFSQMYTVNNLWSICWQHMMRKAIMVFPNLLISSLNLKGLVAKYSRIILAFTMSGCIHAAGAYCATRGSLGDMQMFISQACVIIIEDCFIAVGKRAGIRKSAWTVSFGFLWTIFWFCFCLRGWVGEQLWAGMLATNGHQSVLWRLVKE